MVQNGCRGNRQQHQSGSTAKRRIEVDLAKRVRGLNKIARRLYERWIAGLSRRENITPRLRLFIGSKTRYLASSSGAVQIARNQSRKFWNWSGNSVMDFLTSCIASCRVSRFAPETTYCLPLNAALHLELAVLDQPDDFFCQVAFNPRFNRDLLFYFISADFFYLPLSRQRTSTLRLASLAIRMSSTCPSLNSSSAKMVSV